MSEIPNPHGNMTKKRDMPEMKNEMSKMEDHMHKKEEIIPKEEGGEMKKMNEELLKMEDEMPKMDSAMSKMENEMPKMENDKPNMENEKPKLNKNMKDIPDDDMPPTVKIDNEVDEEYYNYGYDNEEDWDMNMYSQEAYYDEGSEHHGMDKVLHKSSYKSKESDPMVKKMNEEVEMAKNKVKENLKLVHDETKSISELVHQALESVKSKGKTAMATTDPYR